MFLKSIKRKSVEKRILNLVKQKREIPKTKIKTVGILIDGTQFTDFTFVKEFASLFKVASDSISLLYYYPDKKESEKIAGPVFTDAGLGMGAKFKDMHVKEFINAPFDALINYYNEDSLLLNLVAAESKATFKIGFTGLTQHINDFAVTTEPKNIGVFTAELKKYLPILNKL